MATACENGRVGGFTSLLPRVRRQGGGRQRHGDSDARENTRRLPRSHGKSC